MAYGWLNMYDRHLEIIIAKVYARIDTTERTQTNRATRLNKLKPTTDFT